MNSLTLQPHICGRCESAIAPFRCMLDGTQCGCAEPSSPAPVPDTRLCFYTRDVTPQCTGCEWVESDYAPHYAARADCPLHSDLAAPPADPEPVPLAPALDRVEAMRLTMGTTPTELVGERMNEAREDLLEAMKVADRHRETDPYASDLHRRICELVSDIDDRLAYVAERSGS